MTDPCPADFIALGERLADATGEILLRYYRQPLDFDDKADESPVTRADREAEAALRAMIAEAFPGHGIVGEEQGAERADAEYVWVLDPVDGTKAFISGFPIFGTLIALTRRGRSILGIIDHPASGERWVGATGQSTTLNGEAVRVRPRGGLGQSVLWSTSPHMFDADPVDRAGYDRLLKAVKFVHYGGECYQYAMLASGFIDLVVEADMAVHDYCALIPVVEGAGGVITDWQGEIPGFDSDGRIVAAASPELHAAALAALSG